MTSDPSYTIAQAARHAGVSEATIHAWVNAGELKVVPGASPKQVRGPRLERERSERLAKFDDVLDLAGHDLRESPRATGGEDRAVALLQEQVRALESQLRQVIASQATAKEGLQRMLEGVQIQLRGEQGLLDALLSSLPADARMAGDH